MTKLLLTELVNRVVTSQERVQFSQLDPYGHLNASRYVEYLINHRFAALEDQLHVETLEMVKTLNVAFVIARLDTRYHLPSFIGEHLEVASWVETLNATGFDLRLVISGIENRRVRTSALMEIRTVDAKTGKLIRSPDGLLSRSDSEVIKSRPTRDDYLATLERVPSFI